MTNGRVLLMTLSQRTSARGNAYLSGWLGKAQVVGFAGEPDRFGNPTWDIYLTEPEPREGQAGGGAQALGVAGRRTAQPLSHHSQLHRASHPAHPGAAGAIDAQASDGNGMPFDDQIPF